MTMAREDYRALLKEMVKASGQELIEKADDLVGNDDNIVSFSIRIDFPIDGRILTSCPTITVNREQLSKECIRVLADQKPVERKCATCRHKDRENSKRRCFSCETSVGYKLWEAKE